MLASLGVQPPYPHWPRAFRRFTGLPPYFGSKIAVQLCGRGPWDLLGPNYQNYTLPGALLGPKPQIFTLPGPPPRPLKAKSKIIKKQLVFPS